MRNFPLLRFTKIKDSGLYGGKIGSYRYEVYVSKTPSVLGLNNGKISRLCIWDSEKGMGTGCVVNYDSEWLIKPSVEFDGYLRQIVNLYN